MGRDGVFYVLIQEPHNSETATSNAANKSEKDDEKARPHIVLNEGKRRAKLITALVISKASIRNLREKLTSAYQKKNIQLERKLSTKLRNVHNKDNAGIQRHLKILEEGFSGPYKAL